MVVLAEGGALEAAYRVWRACDYRGMRWRYEEALLHAACDAGELSLVYRVLTSLKGYFRSKRLAECITRITGVEGRMW